MSKKKGDTFAAESEFLAAARQKIESNTLTEEQLKSSYAEICEKYEELLQEARFLTRVSDKLEKKLSVANDKLQQENTGLTHQTEQIKSEMGKALKTNKKLSQEKTQLDESQNKLQMTLIFIIAGMLIVMVTMGWFWFQTAEEIDDYKKAGQNATALQKQLEELKKEKAEQDSLTAEPTEATEPDIAE